MVAITAFSSRSVLRLATVLLASASFILSLWPELRSWMRHEAFSGIAAVPLLIPPGLSGAATWFAIRGRAVPVAAMGLLLLVFVFVTGFSIGRWYWPAAGFLFAAMIVAIVDQGAR